MNIAKGTKVRLRTSNGGDAVVRLASMYTPTYGCWFASFANDGTPTGHSFYRNSDDIVSVEPIAEAA